VAGAIVVSAHLRGALPRSVVGLVAEASIAPIVVAVALPVVQRMGGWRQALGLDPPGRTDIKTIAGWIGLQFATRLGIAYLLVILVPALRHHTVSNVPPLHGVPMAAVILTGISAIVIAPIVEEAAFRGVMLRD